VKSRPALFGTSCSRRLFPEDESKPADRHLVHVFMNVFKRLYSRTQGAMERRHRASHYSGGYNLGHLMTPSPWLPSS